MIPEWVKDIPPFVSAGIAFLALIVSCVSVFISIFNYRRDRHRVRVELKWNAEQTRFQGATTSIERLGHITVTNVGRRPVSINFIALHLPGRKRVINWLAIGEVIRLEEGSAPIIKKVHQDTTLEPFVENWKKIKASASDTSRQTYWSKHGGERPILVSGVNPETRRLLQEPNYLAPPKPTRFGGLWPIGRRSKEKE